MNIDITEYLRIDLDSESWKCRVCDHRLGDARENYKEGLLVHDRELSEVHPHLLDPDKYEYTFCPDPAFTALIEYYCPSCATLIEAEYTVPGHPLVRDIELDIDDLKEKAKQWGIQKPDIPEWDMPRRSHSH